jgi:hypothetical protein
MSAMRILFAVMAFVLFFEMIAGKTEDVRINCTFGFMITVVGIVALYFLG